MAIKITENGVVNYENEPNVNRELFPNTPEGGGSPEQIAQAVADYFEDHPTVQDVQINGTSVVQDGVANVPYASDTAGVAKTGTKYGIKLLSNTDPTLAVDSANLGMIKSPDAFQTSAYHPISPKNQHQAVFYGFAKAAGDTTQSASSNAVGIYTEDAKSAIQAMLGVSSIVGTVEGATASTSYSIGDVFLHGGALYKATVAIASGDAIVPGTNCEQTTIIDILKGA